MGEIGYTGPIAGLQEVSLELMWDQCWKCKRDMKTVTGIVFPNRQLNRWDNAGWQYSNTLLPLSELDGENAGAIAAFVEKLRSTDNSITPIGRRYSKTLEEVSFAASCQFCNALKGGFHVDGERMQYLHSLHSRKDGSVEYFSITLCVDQQMITTLSSGIEDCDHACGMGWRYL